MTPKEKAREIVEKHGYFEPNKENARFTDPLIEAIAEALTAKTSSARMFKDEDGQFNILASDGRLIARFLREDEASTYMSITQNESESLKQEHHEDLIRRDPVLFHATSFIGENAPLGNPLTTQLEKLWPNESEVIEHCDKRMDDHAWLDCYRWLKTYLEEKMK